MLVNCVAVNAHTYDEKVDAPTVLIPGSWKPINFEGLPENMAAFIAKQKCEKFAKLYALLEFNSEAVNKWKKEIHCERHSFAKEACEAVILGNLIKEVRRVRKEISLKLEDYFGVLGTINVKGLDEYHEVCVEAFRSGKRIRKVNSAPVEIMEEWKGHFERVVVEDVMPEGQLRITDYFPPMVLRPKGP